MLLSKVSLICGVLAASMVASAGIVTTDRTSLYNFSFSNNTFSDASARYDVLVGVTGNAGDSALSGTFNILRSGYTNFTWTGANGVDISGVTLLPGPAFVATVSTAADTSAGSYDVGYDTPVATDPTISWITSGVSGGLATLNFVNGGGSGVIGAGFQFNVDILLPGNWSTQGTDPGDSLFGSINPAWTIIKNFVFTSGVTEFLATNSDYDGSSGANLNFKLYGSPVPEPGSVVLFATGVAALLLLKRRTFFRVR